MVKFSIFSTGLHLGGSDFAKLVTSGCPYCFESNFFALKIKIDQVLRNFVRELALTSETFEVDQIYIYFPPLCIT